MNILPDNTPIYKYFSSITAISLFTSESLVFQRISNWKDAFEGFRFTFYMTKTADRKLRNELLYYGSSWTLQREDKRLYSSDHLYAKANIEIEKNGSAAMWEDYCKDGGIRIKTTIGKMKEILSGYKDMIHASVFYEPGLDFELYPKEKEEHLFHKRTCFRHENEYRFFIKNLKNVQIVKVPISNMTEFIEEVLIHPAAKNDAWKAQALYRLIANDLSYNYDCNGEFRAKRKFPNCHISQLYSLISEEL